MFSLICACTNSWVHNRDAGDLRHHRAHNDVTVVINCTNLIAGEGFVEVGHLYMNTIHAIYQICYFRYLYWIVRWYHSTVFHPTFVEMWKQFPQNGRAWLCQNIIYSIGKGKLCERPCPVSEPVTHSHPLTLQIVDVAVVPQVSGIYHAQPDHYGLRYS